MDFSSRSIEKELLDNENVPFVDIRKNLRELEFINRYLGGHNITIKGLKNSLKRIRGGENKISICEIGCGGGDNLKVIYQWCAKNGINVTLTGIDINENCITYAGENCRDMNVRFIFSDYAKVAFDIKPDIIFSSLFCHHFTDEQLVHQLQWMKNNAGLAFFVNDLHRHPMAYYSIKYLTRIFSRSYLVRNDAPLSVKRGFVKQDWHDLMKKSGIADYSINWQWAFRWMVTIPTR